LMRAERSRFGVEGGFSCLPWWLADEIWEGKITPSAFGILCYLLLAGADDEGVSTSPEQLARTFYVSYSTASRALRTLRERGLISYESKRGVYGFRVFSDLPSKRPGGYEH
jgi:hypothetical protein